MSIQRAVGEPMRMRLNLGDNAPGKFVRAFLSFDGDPLPIATADLIDLGEGLYGNNTYLMPSGFPVIDVKYIVFLDAGFEDQDPTYFSSTDQYEVSDFDPTNFVPPFPQQVFATVLSGDVTVEVTQPGEVLAVVQNNGIEVRVGAPGEIKVEIENQETITGVLNE